MVDVLKNKPPDMVIVLLTRFKKSRYGCYPVGTQISTDMVVIRLAFLKVKSSDMVVVLLGFLSNITHVLVSILYSIKMS